MSRIAAVLSTVALLVTASCGPRSTSLSEVHASAIRDSVEAVMARFHHHSSSANWDSLASLYSPTTSFRFLESGTVQYASRAAVREALGQVPPGTHITTTYRDLQIDPIAPGVAMVTGLFETAFADTTGPQFRFGGALSLLWAHEAEGWRIRSGHSSAPVPRRN